MIEMDDYWWTADYSLRTHCHLLQWYASCSGIDHNSSRCSGCQPPQRRVPPDGGHTTSVSLCGSRPLYWSQPSQASSTAVLFTAHTALMFCLLLSVLDKCVALVNHLMLRKVPHGADADCAPPWNNHPSPRAKHSHSSSFAKRHCLPVSNPSTAIVPPFIHPARVQHGWPRFFLCTYLRHVLHHVLMSCVMGRRQVLHV